MKMRTAKTVVKMRIMNDLVSAWTSVAKEEYAAICYDDDEMRTANDDEEHKWNGKTAHSREYCRRVNLCRDLVSAQETDADHWHAGWIMSSTSHNEHPTNYVVRQAIEMLREKFVIITRSRKPVDGTK